MEEMICDTDAAFLSTFSQLKIDQRVFLNPSKRKIDVNIISSSYHQEITPSDAAGYDRLVIQDVLKEIAQTQQVNIEAKHRFKGETDVCRSRHL